MSTEDAWVLIKEAVNERDIDDVKEAVQTYVKSSPSTTYPELEEAFRSQKLPLWLIAIEKTGLVSTLTNMDLQGELEKKYTVTYRFQWNPPRPRDREVWPKDVEENIERLKDAGEVVPRGVPKCRNCGQVGHTSKSCPEEKLEKQATTINCYNCDAVGHRIRDCPIPRVDKFACKNCGVVTKPLIAPSPALLLTWSVASATRLDISPRTAPREADSLAATVTRRVTGRESAPSLATLRTSSAATVMSLAT
ncbi:hypothetical protein B0T26DRAFT_112661 [Lasiosphaeria miniovina]|uniref:CCHC-type domain-containing protein n=1 Tax=Lasiosphaeria miniovina TaxID=1954250 RepID=A0AA40B3T9_9PEZI|nr:uncharacterized protein B0T26DRAFT_112661 [Lasiosphaeria miniovina]KAK0727013.1 hypothetical protein B0T26DRAFT_112661 [Lasiosphaeria miniovina]